MKKILLAASLVLVGSTIAPAISSPIEADAKTAAFTKKDINAIKKGTFVHAKGKLGDSQKTLIKKGVKKDSDFDFVQLYDVDLSFKYSFSLYNTQIHDYEQFDTLQYIYVDHDEKINYSIFNKYFKRSKKDDVPLMGFDIIAYKVGEKYLLVTKGTKTTEMWLFKNKKVLKRFLSAAG